METTLVDDGRPMMEGKKSMICTKGKEKKEKKREKEERRKRMCCPWGQSYHNSSLEQLGST